MYQDQIAFAFPTPIMHRQIDGAESMNQTLAKTIREWERSEPSNDYGRAQQGGFFTPTDTFSREFEGKKELLAHIRHASISYLRSVVKQDSGRDIVPEQYDLSIWGWGSITRERHYQTPHVHPGASISGVYYIHVPEGKPVPQGCTDFYVPFDTKEMTFIPGASSSYCRVIPENGMMILFPSYCRHLVHPFIGEGERIIVAFNVKVTPVGGKRA